MKTCFFIGHRDTPESVKPLLTNAIERHIIEYGVTEKDFDSTYYPPDMEKVPKQFAIIRANEHMIKVSDYLISYNKGYVGKTRDFVEIALRREQKGLLRVENLG